jgi:hypothetical protein
LTDYFSNANIANILNLGLDIMFLTPSSPALKSATIDIIERLVIDPLTTVIKRVQELMGASKFGQNPVLYHLLAHLHMLNGKHASAMVATMEMKKHGTGHSLSALLLQAEISLYQNQLQIAIDIAECALGCAEILKNKIGTINIFSANALLMLVKAHERLGNKEKTAEYITALLTTTSSIIASNQIDEHTHYAYLFRAEAKLITKDFLGAEEDATKAHAADDFSKLMDGIQNGSPIISRGTNILVSIPALMVRAEARLLLKNGEPCLRDLKAIQKFQSFCSQVWTLRAQAKELLSTESASAGARANSVFSPASHAVPTGRPQLMDLADANIVRKSFA